MSNKILRIPQLCSKLGICRATVYRFVDLENFPKPIQLGPRSVGWLEEEINTWISNRAEKRKITEVKNG